MPTANKEHFVKLRVDTHTKELWDRAKGAYGLSDFIRKAVTERAQKVLNDEHMAVAEVKLSERRRTLERMGKGEFSPDFK